MEYCILVNIFLVSTLHVKIKILYLQTSSEGSVQDIIEDGSEYGWKDRLEDRVVFYMEDEESTRFTSVGVGVNLFPYMFCGCSFSSIMSVNNEIGLLCVERNFFN